MEDMKETDLAANTKSCVPTARGVGGDVIDYCAVKGYR